ncbi:MAG: hypothetical protein KGS73_19075 [Chloroflexi bacterium]|nr:hypothetical protein [Chloroflexota bacterium]
MSHRLLFLSQSRRAWGFAGWIGLLCASLLGWGAVHAQTSTTPILLGEFVNADLAAGEEAAYVLTIRDDATYTVVSTGESSPDNFQLTILRDDESVVYEETLADLFDVELTAGDYLLLFVAQQSAELGFVVGVEAGSMSADPSLPGELFNGATFVTSAVTEPLYAEVAVEESQYPQQLAILVQGADEDRYTAELVDSATADSATITTDQSDVLLFPTQGGVYELTVTPDGEGAELQVSVFLSGPAPVLQPGIETSDDLLNPDDTNLYQFAVAEAGTTVHLVATSNEMLTLEVSFWPGEGFRSAYSFGDEPARLTFVAPVAGTYYLDVSSDSETGAAYTVQFEEGELASTLPLATPVDGQIEAGTVVGYLVQVDTAEQFLIVVLAGHTEDDLDLQLSRYADETITASDISQLGSSKEIVSTYVEEPGTYIVLVDSTWSDQGADFSISAGTIPVTDLLTAAADETESNASTPSETAPSETLEQWAVSASASSQYGDDDWSAQQATGEPDTLIPGDEVTAWAAYSSDSQLETLVLAYAQPVIPVGLEIYESYNPGAVVRVEFFDLNTDEWVVAWEGTAESAGLDFATFRPALISVNFATDQVRLTVDEPSVSGWNEIDAVKLIGIPD